MILEKSLYPWMFHPRNSDFEPGTSNRVYVRSVNLLASEPDPADILKPRAGEIDESYQLELTADGVATISAQNSIGLVRGLSTFTQLFYRHSAGGSYTDLAPVSIVDSPTFVHRGLNHDLSRSYFPVEAILRTIDALAFNKFNRYHLHITDSQSWPLVIPALPELSREGAYRPDFVYTPEDLEYIQRYAALQGVQTIIEIDMPGHTASIWFSHPELIAAFNIQPNWPTYAAQPPTGTLKLNSSDVYDFLDTLFDDLLPRLSPYSAYYHTGGDEVNLNSYTLDDTVGTNDTAVLQPLMQRFIDTIHGHVRDAGLTPVVWEEMLLTWNLTLGEDVIVQTWQSNEALAETVAQGHKALAGNYNYWVSPCSHCLFLSCFLSLSSPSSSL